MFWKRKRKAEATDLAQSLLNVQRVMENGDAAFERRENPRY